MTYRQLVERIAQARRRRIVLLEVPVLTPRLSSLWLHLVTPVNASVARPLVEGLRNPTVAHEERLHSLVPFELTPFDTMAVDALSAGSDERLGGTGAPASAASTSTATGRKAR